MRNIKKQLPEAGITVQNRSTNIYESGCDDFPVTTRSRVNYLIFHSNKVVFSL